MQIYKLSRKFPNIPPTFSHTFTQIPAKRVAKRTRPHADLADFGGGRWVLDDSLRFAIRVGGGRTNTNHTNPHESFLYLLSYAPNVERKRKNVFFRHVIIENFTFYVYVFTFIFRDCQALTNVLMIRADSGDSCSFFDHSVKICQICVRWCG